MKACRGSDSEPQLELEPLNESINTRALEIPLTLNFIENRTTVKTTMTVFSLETRETIDLLRRVVDKLDERNGCISAEELWDDVLRYVLGTCIPNIHCS